jgi:hypothetical protein
MRRPSRTAVNTAVWRAVHTLLNEELKILAGPFVRAFAGFNSDEACWRRTMLIRRRACRAFGRHT